MSNSSEQKTFVINTMSEDIYLALSAQGKISEKQLNIVDDNDTNRTVVASYDLLGKRAGTQLEYKTVESKPWIVLKNRNGDELSKIDASDFIRDGVLNRIEYTGSGLKFTIKVGDTETIKTVDFVDDSLISTSTNAVTNRAVTSAFIEIKGLLNNKADVSYVDSQVSGKADKTEIKNWALSSDVSAMRESLETVIGTKVTSADYIAKIEEIEESLASKTTKEYVDGISGSLQAEIDGKAAEADVESLCSTVKTISSDYLKGSDKTELQNAIDLKADKTDFESLSGTVKTVSSDYLKSTDKTELQNAISLKADKTAVSDIAKTLSAVSSDYLKSSDKEDIEGKITKLTGTVSAVSSDYLKSSDKTELQNAIDLKTDKTDFDSLAGTVSTISSDYLKGSDKTELQNAIGLKASQSDLDAIGETVNAVSSDYLKSSDKTELQSNIDGRKSVTFRLRDGGFLENITENKIQRLTDETAHAFVENVMRTIVDEARVAVIRAGDWKFDVAETIQSDTLSGFACVGVNASVTAAGISDPYVCKFTVVDDGAAVTAVYGDTRIADAISSVNVSQWTNDSGYAVSADVDSKLGGYYTKEETYDRSEVQQISAGITANDAVTVTKLATAETGYFATYEVRQNGVKVGDSVNIPKDFLVKSGVVSECVEDDKPIAGLVVGDKYLDFTVNVKAGEGEESHIYINVKDLTDVYVGAETDTVKTVIGSGNEISAIIRDSSITAAKLDAGCVTMPKLGEDVSSYITGQYSSAVEYADEKIRGLSAENLAGGAGKTITAITETSGVVSASFENISIEQSQVQGLDDTFDSYWKKTETSSASELSDKFSTLSTYAETSGQLSGDGYALTSKTSSDVQLQAAFAGQSGALAGIVSGLWAGLSVYAYQDAEKMVPKTSATITVGELAASIVNVMTFISAAWSTMQNS